MFKVWVNITTGGWGRIEEVRVIETQNFQRFQEIFDSLDDKERIDLAIALGKSIKE